MNRKHELYVDMNEVMKIFHSFDNSNDNDNDNGVTADSDEQMNLVDEIIDEYNLIPSNIKVQKKSHNKNYKEQDVTQFECVKSNSKVSNISNSNSSISSSRETKANGGNICKFNFNNTEQFTIVKESNCCITGNSSNSNSNSNNSNKCCCCIVDNDKITQLIKLINALHTKLNETNSKLTALSTSLPKVNFPSENTHNNKYTITSNTNTISYPALTSYPDTIPNSNKPKRSFNDTFTFNTNASKKQQPITSFLHKQFKHK